MVGNSGAIVLPVTNYHPRVLPLLGLLVACGWKQKLSTVMRYFTLIVEGFGSMLTPARYTKHTYVAMKSPLNGPQWYMPSRYVFAN